MTNVKLPAGIWVDLYAATGITIGNQLEVINLTPNDIRLAASAGEPTVSTSHVPLTYRSAMGRNDSGDVGAWAFCMAGGGINVSDLGA